MIEILFEGKLASINNRYNKNFSLTQTYRNCKTELQLAYRLANVKKTIFTKPVWVSIEWDKGRMDLDAPIKVILDAMKGEIIKDDKQVERIIVEHCKGMKTIIRVGEL